jgi:hypothetical protein
MVSTVTKPARMVSSRWTEGVRHCMHILATHYPTSSWADRAAILNLICNETLSPNQVRDEYGGHPSGRRNRPGNAKATRSFMWNDEICCDEFGLAGPFTQAQRVTRGTMLRNIQAAIVSLGLGNNTGLGAVNLVAGMEMANFALATVAGTTATMAPAVAPSVAAAPPATLAGLSSTAPAAQAGPCTATTAPTAQTGHKRTRSDSDSDDGIMVNAEDGLAAWYHSREIVREGPSGHLTYREIPGLSYDQPPMSTIGHRVRFPARGMEWIRIRICDAGGCELCGELVDKGW